MWSTSDQLRMVISEALSDIGVISNSAVQRTLLQLAADKELGVQAVAARAMARWRYHKHDAELISTLQNWQLQTLWLDVVAEMLKQHDEQKKDEPYLSPRDYIRATVALTVSYASQYDPPNMLSQEICDLLKNLADDVSPLVRNRFRNHTLPLVVSLHTTQLRDILHDMVRYIDLVPAIGASLALAYRYNTQSVLETLEIWHQECRNKRPARINPAEITLRDALLATIE